MESKRVSLYSSCKRLTSAAIVASMLFATGCRAQKSWPLWESYSAKFLDDQGRVIDHSAVDRSTSEGEAYAMFFALVQNDRARFDKLLSWTENNLAAGDLTQHLPAWSWGKASDGSWRALDSNSASDADLWMAYTLCQAGRLWHVDRYTRLGITMANRIAHEDLAMVPPAGVVMVPGEQGFHPTPTTWYINPSYLPPSLLAYFAHQAPAGSPWGGLLANLPELVRTSGGYAMDWMLVSQDSGAMASPPPSVVASLQQGQQAPTPVGSYDAIRVYLWAGLADPRTPHLAELRKSLSGMDRYLASGAVTPPLQVGPEGQILNPAAPPGFSAAVLPFLHSLNRKDAESAQANRLAATLDASTGLYGHDGMYYDQNLALFALGAYEGRYRFGPNGELFVKWKS